MLGVLWFFVGICPRPWVIPSTSTQRSDRLPSSKLESLHVTLCSQRSVCCRSWQLPQRRWMLRNLPASLHLHIECLGVWPIWWLLPWIHPEIS